MRFCMESPLLPFDLATKNVWEVIFEDSKIPKWKKDALLVLFGNLTFKSKLSKNERESDPLYLFDLERIINDITRLMGDSEDLNQVWAQNRQIITQSLVN